jgi:hypothetical protein
VTEPLYFATYIPGTETVISLLQGEFGSQLEKLDYTEKSIFRAALSNYVANYAAYDHDDCSDPNDLIDTCIEGAGVIWDIWENAQLVKAIRMCRILHEKDMEALIDSLSEQIRNGIYSSRGES